MKKITLSLLLSFISVLSFAQDKAYIDSLHTALRNHHTEDTIRLNIMVEIAAANQSVDRVQSFDYIKLALALAEKLEDKTKTGECLNHLGDLYWYAGDYTSASEKYFRALKIYEGLNNPSGISECYRNIGWIYQGQENFTKTIEYYNKALDINLKNGLKKKLVSNYDDLGIVHKLIGKNDKAIEYCTKAIELSKEMGMQRGMAAGYGNLGGIYSKMGEYEKALESYKLSNEIHVITNDVYNTAEGYNGMAESYLMLKRPNDALNCIEKGMAISQKYGFKNNIASCHYQFALAYAQLSEYQKAYKNMEIYLGLKDSTYNERNSQQINEMSAKYESDKKELMISSLEKDNTIAADKLEKEKNFKIYLIVFCLMIAGFAFALFRGNVHKKKANDALSFAYKEIEVKNKDITDSINYSKRIQEATLPPKEMQYKLFPDSFVLFQPKDIVSGDFYWYAEKNGKKLIASCDCTGHGVPGALMSMIGNNLLNQIVLEKGITSPDQILNHLHIEIRKALKQDEQPESRDGMDVAILVFNSDSEVEFAGAQRPFWLIRNHEIEEIKGDKFSIGGMQTEETRTFTKTTHSIRKNDSMYIFSDGFVDQFGGSHGKKFMTKNFKELLSTIHDEPMALQKKTIQQTFEKWQGIREQVDDVLVIGIRV